MLNFTSLFYNFSDAQGKETCLARLFCLQTEPGLYYPDRVGEREGGDSGQAGGRQVVGGAELPAWVAALQPGLARVIEEEVEAPGGPSACDVWREAAVEARHPLGLQDLPHRGQVGGPAGAG